jgi:hypothetical protein
MFPEAPPWRRVQEATMNRTLTRALSAIALGTLLLQPVTTMADPPAHARNENSAKHRQDYWQQRDWDDRAYGRGYRGDYRRGYDDDHRYSSRDHWRHGHVVRYLPPRARVVHYHGDRYYYGGGAWYRPYGPGFVVVNPPIGLVVSFLPEFRTTVYFGGVPYYGAGPVYYVWDKHARGYVVTDGPRGRW